MPEKITPHERELGEESEGGATSRERHDDILVRQLGRERGLDVATRDGAPRPGKRKA